MSTWALLAQGIERLPPEQKAVGSNPTEGAISFTSSRCTDGLFTRGR